MWSNHEIHEFQNIAYTTKIWSYMYCSYTVQLCIGLINPNNILILYVSVFCWLYVLNIHPQALDVVIAHVSMVNQCVSVRLLLFRGRHTIISNQPSPLMATVNVTQTTVITTSLWWVGRCRIYDWGEPAQVPH